MQREIIASTSLSFILFFSPFFALFRPFISSSPLKQSMKSVILPSYDRFSNCRATICVNLWTLLLSLESALKRRKIHARTHARTRKRPRIFNHKQYPVLWHVQGGIVMLPGICKFKWEYINTRPVTRPFPSARFHTVFTRAICVVVSDFAFHTARRVAVTHWNLGKRYFYLRDFCTMKVGWASHVSTSWNQQLGALDFTPLDWQQKWDPPPFPR